MHSYLQTMCLNHNCRFSYVGGVEDHVHLLINIPKNLTVSSLVEKLKKSSSRWAKENAANNKLLADFYWQSGYGAFSVSHSKIEQVKKYIANQKKHHKKFSMQDELRKLLNCHGVEFQEKYLWD